MHHSRTLPQQSNCQHYCNSSYSQAPRYDTAGTALTAARAALLVVARAALQYICICPVISVVPGVSPCSTGLAVCLAS